MELGQKIKTARLELGLSQRQLCDGKITRNMLSQIENGSARPSMDTLSWLAPRLGKPISWFLEETAVVSSNTELMEQVRQFYEKGESRQALEALHSYKAPDPVFDREMRLLEYLCCLAQAEQALEEKHIPYARTVLNRADTISCTYITQPLRQRLLLLQSRAGEQVRLSCDEILLRRAELETEPWRQLEILQACEDRQSPQWQLQAGLAYLHTEQYSLAKEHFLAAEEAFPQQVWPHLETCCRQLEDFRGAYEYACKQK